MLGSRRGSLAMVVTALAVGLLLAPASAYAKGSPKKKPHKSNPQVTVSFFHDDMQNHVFRFAATITNSASKALVGVRVEWSALDAAGSLLGAHQRDLPAIPAHGESVYVGGAGSANLTGDPASVKIKVLDKGHLRKLPRADFLIEGVTLAPEESQTFSNTPTYVVNADATVQGKSPVTTASLVPTVVLKDAGGQIVGGDFDTVTNLPQILDPGTKFHLQLRFVEVTGTPASADVTVDRTTGG